MSFHAPIIANGHAVSGVRIGNSFNQFSQESIDRSLVSSVDRYAMHRVMPMNSRLQLRAYYRFDHISDFNIFHFISPFFPTNKRKGLTKWEEIFKQTRLPDVATRVSTKISI
jgi:hypothetical protein